MPPAIRVLLVTNICALIEPNWPLTGRTCGGGGGGEPLGVKSRMPPFKVVEYAALTAPDKGSTATTLVRLPIVVLTVAWLADDRNSNCGGDFNAN